MFKSPSWLLPCILADCLISRNTWVLGYNMGKADLTNLFIEGQKVSLEAVNITVDDRKKYPGEILLLKILEIDDDQTHPINTKKHQACRTNTNIEPPWCGRASSVRETISTKLFRSLSTSTTGEIISSFVYIRTPSILVIDS